MGEFEGERRKREQFIYSLKNKRKHVKIIWNPEKEAFLFGWVISHNFSIWGSENIAEEG